MGLNLAWGLCLGVAHAGGGDHARAFDADGLWLDPFPGDALGTTSPWLRSRSFHAGLTLGFQNEPLVANLASPDPFGTEVRVLDDWWTAQLFASAPLGRFDLGLALPMALASAGAGTSAVYTRGSSNSQTGLGDPRVTLRLNHSLGGVSIAVLQRVSLPLGSEASLLAGPGFGYMPALAVGRDFGTWWLSAQAGVRLRHGVDFGGVRFASEAELSLASGVDLGGGFATNVEAWATPSLETDEADAAQVTRELRRVPSEVLLSFSRDFERFALRVGVGTSLALSREQVFHAEGRLAHHDFSGPPAPNLRLVLQLEANF